MVLRLMDGVEMGDCSDGSGDGGYYSHHAESDMVGLPPYLLICKMGKWVGR